MQTASAALKEAPEISEKQQPEGKIELDIIMRTRD
jgi:hypothetical protein